MSAGSPGEAGRRWFAHGHGRLQTGLKRVYRSFLLLYSARKSRTVAAMMAGSSALRRASMRRLSSRTRCSSRSASGAGAAITSGAASGIGGVSVVKLIGCVGAFCRFCCGRWRIDQEQDGDVFVVEGIDQDGDLVRAGEVLATLLHQGVGAGNDGAGHRFS